jgi:AhpD family alkylhydroperoxidase
MAVAMTPRIHAYRVAPGAMKAMTDLGQYVAGCGLEAPLLELVKMRASQINGCAFCLDMHSKDARAAGETEQRLYALNAWHETPFFTDRERAALGWTEEITRISEGHASDEAYLRVREEFSEEEVVNLTLAIVVINGWNRIALTIRSVPGSYKP